VGSLCRSITCLISGRSLAPTLTHHSLYHAPPTHAHYSLLTILSSPPPEPMPSVLILGTGALATLFAARLSAAGVQVTLLGTWAEGLKALREKGASLEGAGAFPVQATDDPAACQGANFALILVKAWQTELAARQLQHCLAADGLALTLQNGLGNYESLSAALGEQRVALGVTTLGATLLGPGLVRLGGEGLVTLQTHARLQPLADLLQAAGFNVSVVQNARSLAWGKLVISAAINPLTALLRVPNGKLLEIPAARELMGELATETARVARALGVSLSFHDPVRAVEGVARQTGDNHSSMLQDVLRGAPTEIDALNGAVVRAGERVGVPTPTNRVIWQLLRAMQNEHGL
jgi:2-dehydropantoate 2-reductase